MTKALQLKTRGGMTFVKAVPLAQEYGYTSYLILRSQHFLFTAMTTVVVAFVLPETGIVKCFLYHDLLTMDAEAFLATLQHDARSLPASIE